MRTVKAERGFGALTRRSVLRAFNSWIDETLERKRRRAALGKIVIEVAAPTAGGAVWRLGRLGR